MESIWTEIRGTHYAETDPYAKAVIRNVLDELETGEEPEPESLHISVDFHLLMREGGGNR